MTSSFKSVQTITFESIMHATLLASPLFPTEERALKVLCGCGPHHRPQDGAPEVGADGELYTWEASSPWEDRRLHGVTRVSLL